MAYERTSWVDHETEVNADRMNHMEDGIEEANINADTAKSDASTALSNSQTAQTDAAAAVDTANNAASTASQAATDASSAINTANDAKSVADAAISTANSANEIASNAEATANQAEQDVKDVISKALAIDDDNPSNVSTYSSNKIEDMVGTKADSSDLENKADKNDLESKLDKVGGDSAEDIVSFESLDAEIVDDIEDDEAEAADDDAENDDTDDSDDDAVETISNNHWEEVELMTSGETHASLFKKISTMFKNIRYLHKALYPIGSIYMSVNDTDPGTLFGGTWERIEDAFLLACGSSHAAGESGGAETVTLTSAQMPSHTHSTPSHTHSIPSLSGTAASAGGHKHALLYNNSQYASGSLNGFYANGTGGSSTNAIETAGAHTHTVTTTSSTTGSSSGTSGSTGSGSAHNNMPPYLAVYMWQRVA